MDPRCHEELRNGPEVKIYIREVIFLVPKKVWFFRYCTGKVLEGTGGSTMGPNDPGKAHMDQGMGLQATWAGRTIPQGSCCLNPEIRSYL